MVRYGMVFDLRKCVRCRTCMIACKIEHNIPTEFESSHQSYRIYPLAWEEGNYPNVISFLTPILCMHCDDPPCLFTCPTGAIYKGELGNLLISEEKCVGCKSCVDACPYGAIYYNCNKHKVDKCDLCSKRINKGLKPACAEACPAQAIFFGDLDSKESEISRIIASEKAEPLLEYQTKPKVFYIFRQKPSSVKLQLKKHLSRNCVL